MLEKWTATCKRTKLDHSLIHKNLKWNKDLNRRPETIKLLDETSHIGGKLSDISLVSDSLPLIPKAKATEAKNKQVGKHQTKNLLHSKRNHQQNENANHISYTGLICKMHKES